MNQVKIIFLDFDGVITTLKSRWMIDNDKIKLLQKIIDFTDAKIVISSSWRTYDLQSTIDNLSKEGSFPFCDRIIGITPYIGMFRYNDKINDNGTRPTIHSYRGVEIDDWLNNTNYNVINYVILDDNTDILYDQRNNFVKTDIYIGLSDENVQQAINILNKEG